MVLVLVLILGGNQIGRAASIPVFGVDVDIDVSAGAGIWRWRRHYYYYHVLKDASGELLVKFLKERWGGRHGNQSRRASLLAATIF